MAMDEDEWEAVANAHLDICDECDLELHDAHCEPVEFYRQLNERYEHAKLAFPGLSVEEFLKIDNARTQPDKKRGGQPQPAYIKAQEPRWQAARDAERLKEHWKALHPGKKRPKPPLLPEQIAATRRDVRDRNGDVDPEIVVAAVRRPKSRQWHKK